MVKEDLSDVPTDRLLEAAGQRAADKMARWVGSWTFVMIQSAALAFWVWLNIYGRHIFDPYPFQALNLLLSFQAAYTGPILLIAANHQAAHDRELMLEILRRVKARAA